MQPEVILTLDLAHPYATTSYETTETLNQI
jgi:hypothetical protein